MTQEHLFLTVSQATERLNKAGINVHRTTVQRWCRIGRIPAVRLPGGSYYRIHAKDVDAILKPAEVAA